MKSRSFELIAVPLLLAACGGPAAPPPAAPAAAPVVAAAPPPVVAAPPVAAPPPPPACAAGTHAEEGRGCVADAPPPPPPPCGAGMALVKGGGPFKMGALKQATTVGDFCLDTTEVTADAYAACVKAGGCSADHLKCAEAATYEAAGKGDHPMVCVDFTQATAYCAAQKKRLPTQAEWEWAARGGAEGRTYPWGNDAPADQLCWSGKSPLTGTCAVGSFAKGASPEGIHDLAGNVFEWTTSDSDAKSPLRVGRGGSWRDGVAEQVRAARPGGFAVTYRCGFLGIRCVTEPAKGP